MMKGQKGITLVALIITIIVMLILVGVSISVALNGGLFTKARTAKEQTLEKQLDEAVSLVIAYYYSDNEDPTTTYTAPDATAFQTELQKYIPSATVEDTTGKTGWFTVTNGDDTVYVNIASFTTSKEEPTA